MTLGRTKAPRCTYRAGLRSAGLQAEFFGLLQKRGIGENLWSLRFRISLNAESGKSGKSETSETSGKTESIRSVTFESIFRKSLKISDVDESRKRASATAYSQGSSSKVLSGSPKCSDLSRNEGSEKKPSHFIVGEARTQSSTCLKVWRSPEIQWR